MVTGAAFTALARPRGADGCRRTGEAGPGWDDQPTVVCRSARLPALPAGCASPHDLRGEASRRSAEAGPTTPCQVALVRRSGRWV
ncbi:hypothetical protein FRAAL0745 [Frankia alni ACN14a]|uniref:Uncharacterized protein n=1 Tax=Frankia alni (strain DSM 45986 / CECT 9034 / ACN14a) TaxID=326424 RepID=Q0RSP2_FRAAA|nr:hypothetical protein FRAAL0745 [Frankia alni ACN14a]